MGDDKNQVNDNSNGVEVSDDAQHQAGNDSQPPLQGAAAGQAQIRINWVGVTKGFILVAWIVLLVYAASLAATRQVYPTLVKMPDTFRGYINGGPADEGKKNYRKIFEINSVWGLLQSYETKAPAPVISSILDLGFPRWDDARKVYEHGQFAGMDGVCDAYCRLFESVDNYLNAVVLSKDFDPTKARISHGIAPPVFKFSASNEEIAVPAVAVSWINSMRERLEKDEQLSNLIDSFFIMLVLGAFGSMVFLIKDFLYGEVRVKVAQYVFRPVLGMFLAMTVFLMDILTHSVLSTASIEALRLEPLFFLGIVSGMLAEQTYGVIYARAQKVIKKAAEEAGVSRDGGNG